MKGHRGRTKLGLTSVFLFCSLFFLVGFFFGSLLLSQDLSGPRLSRSKLMEVGKVDEEVEELRMDHGETGEPHPYPIPFQAIPAEIPGVGIASHGCFCLLFLESNGKISTTRPNQA